MNACPAALRLRGPTVSELTGYIRRPGKAQPLPGKLTVQQDRLGGELCLPGGAALARAYRIWAYGLHP